MGETPIRGFEVPRDSYEGYIASRATWTDIAADAKAKGFAAFNSKGYAKSGYAVIYEGKPDVMFICHQNW